MSELKKLLEGLPIRILDKNCAEIGGGRYLRSQIQRWADDEANGTSHRLGARLILALMDEFEEPKPEVGSSAPPYCVEHNCQMILSVYNRPGSPPGNAWSCPECANERESKPADKPAWEPGTVLVSRTSSPEFPYRLDTRTGSVEDGEDWQATRLTDGEKSESHFKYADWRIHRLPHEFKVGDWFRCTTGLCKGGRVEKNNGEHIIDQHGSWHHTGCALHVPAPKEANSKDVDYDWADEAEVANEISKEFLFHGRRPDPFQGPHWDALDAEIAEIEKRKSGLGIGPTHYPLLRQRDLRDEARRMKEAK